MSAFPKMSLTNAGINLQTKVQGGVILEFTRIGLGDGNLNGQPISVLTKLINQTANVPINDKKILNNNTLQVSGFFSNQDIQTGFYWREFGVFANDPDSGEVLYAYSNAGNAGDYIPTIEDQRIEKYIYASFTVQNAESVTITIPSGDTFIPASEKGKPNGVAELDENGKLPADALPNNLPTLGEDGKIPAEQLPDMDFYTKDETLSEQTKTLFGLSAEAVPDDVLKKALSLIATAQDKANAASKVVFGSYTGNAPAAMTQNTNYYQTIQLPSTPIGVLLMENGYATGGDGQSFAVRGGIAYTGSPLNPDGSSVVKPLEIVSTGFKVCSRYGVSLTNLNGTLYKYIAVL